MVHAHGDSSEECFEKQVTTTVLRTLLSVVGQLFGTWGMRRKARRLVSKLPEYEGTVPVPGVEKLLGWLEELCALPHRRPGTAEGHAAEDWVAEKMRGLGLEDVRKDPIDMEVWSAEEWGLSVAGVEVPSFYIINTAFTEEEGVSAPLVYVGLGTKQEYDGQDVAGKIVVADVPFPVLPTGFIMKFLRACFVLSDPEGIMRVGTRQRLNFVRQNFLGGVTEETAPENDVYWQAVSRGAVGVCLILRDQPGNSNTHYGPYDGIMKPLPGLWIG